MHLRISKLGGALALQRQLKNYNASWAGGCVGFLFLMLVRVPITFHQRRSMNKPDVPALIKNNYIELCLEVQILATFLLLDILNFACICKLCSQCLIQFP